VFNIVIKRSGLAGSQSRLQYEFHHDTVVAHELRTESRADAEQAPVGGSNSEFHIWGVVPPAYVHGDTISVTVALNVGGESRKLDATKITYLPPKTNPLTPGMRIRVCGSILQGKGPRLRFLSVLAEPVTGEEAAITHDDLRQRIRRTSRRLGPSTHVFREFDVTDSMGGQQVRRLRQRRGVTVTGHQGHAMQRSCNTKMQG